MIIPRIFRDYPHPNYTERAVSIKQAKINFSGSHRLFASLEILVCGEIGALVYHGIMVPSFHSICLSTGYCPRGAIETVRIDKENSVS